MSRDSNRSRFTLAVIVTLAVSGTACSPPSSPIAPTPPATAVETTDLEGSLMISIQGMSLDSTIEMTSGEQLKAAVFVVASDGTRSDVSSDVAWTSNDASVAEVDRGVIVARKAGRAMLGATYRDMTSQFQVTVNPSAADSPNAGTNDGTETGTGGSGNGGVGGEATVTGLSISGGGNLTLGGTTQLLAIARMSNGSERNVTSQAGWSSSQPGVASVSGGVVTANGSGSAVISAEHGGQTTTVPVQVAAPVPPPPPLPIPPLPTPPLPGIPTLPTSPVPSPPTPSPSPVVAVSVAGPDSTRLLESTQYTATAYFSDGSSQDVTAQASWSSGGLGSIQGGLLQALGLGSRSVTATYNGQSGSRTVNVTP